MFSSNHEYLERGVALHYPHLTTKISQHKTHTGLPNYIGSDSSFAASEASFASSEASGAYSALSNASSCTAASDHYKDLEGSNHVVQGLDVIDVDDEVHQGASDLLHLFNSLDSLDQDSLGSIGRDSEEIFHPQQVDRQLYHEQPAIRKPYAGTIATASPNAVAYAPFLHGRSSAALDVPASFERFYPLLHLQQQHNDQLPHDTPQSTYHLHPPRQHDTQSAPLTNPRRTIPDKLRPPPKLVRQEARKEAYVETLMDITQQLLECIWPEACPPVPNSRLPGNRDLSASSMRRFIKKVLMNSKASHSTLQMAMYYCYRVWRTGPGSTYDIPLPNIECRRMFLASVMIAYKYLQDRNYSARAWSQISGLTKAEIMDLQLQTLQFIDYGVHVDMEDWDYWRVCVDRSASQRNSGKYKNQWSILLRQMRSHQITTKYRREMRHAQASVLRLGNWDWSKEDEATPASYLMTHIISQTTSSSSIRGSKFLTPPSSPETLPDAPVMTALTTPDDSPCITRALTSPHHATNGDEQKQISRVEASHSTEPPRDLILPYRSITTSAVSVKLPTLSSSTSQAFETRPSATERTRNPHYTSDAHTWYEKHKEIIDSYENKVDRQMATRSAKKIPKGPHSRKRSIGRCLGKGNDDPKERRAKARCHGTMV